ARNGSEFPLTDGLASVIALTDAAGSISSTYTYSPFAETTVQGSSSNRRQFAGRENDGTGLYFYRARYYYPAAARFISEDPAGMVDGLNVYTYVRSGPTNAIDPLVRKAAIIHGVQVSGTPAKGFSTGIENA